MKCYDNGILQSYLDKEVPGKTEREIKEHLKLCTLCSDKLIKIQEQNKMLNSLLHRIDPGHVPVPDFVTKRPRTGLLIRIAGIAAAIILIMIIVYTSENREAIHQDMEIPAGEIFIQEYLEWEDPNYLWQNKTQIYPFADKGENIVTNSSKK